jgi:hypothetical protein
VRRRGSGRTLVLLALARAVAGAALGEVRADVARLAAGSYRRCGTWDLATMCDHLARGIEVGLAGTTIPMPMPLRLLGPALGPWLLRRMLRTRSMPAGVKAPGPFVPAEHCECGASVARLNAAIDRAQALAGPMPRHPFFGRWTVGQWRDFMVVHAMHHLSFLVPVE